MSDKIRERFDEWERLYWLDKKKYPRNDQCYEAGYQSATSDTKALVGDLVEALATYGTQKRYSDITALITKATAWLSETPPTDKE